LRSGPTSAGAGTDHREIAKHNRKKVAIETAVRKRMMEYTSNTMSFDWVSDKTHEVCQMGQVFGSAGKKEKKRDAECFENFAVRYRYANCSLVDSCGMTLG